MMCMKVRGIDIGGVVDRFVDGKSDYFVLSCLGSVWLSLFLALLGSAWLSSAWHALAWLG